MTLDEVLISKDSAGRTYKFEGNSESFVRREFSPNLFARLENRFFYESPHPLSTEAGHAFAYWKRRLAHRLSMLIDDNVNIVDALEISQNGFISPFIVGDKPAKREMQQVRAQARDLEDVFVEIGMPSLSYNPRNFIVQNGQVYVINYEQSFPLPDTRGIIDCDIIYSDDIYRFISDNRQQFVNRLGTTELQNLDESFEAAEHYHRLLDKRPKRLTTFGEQFTRPISKRDLNETVERLYEEGIITEDELEDYRSGKTKEHIGLATKNLGVHAGISIATPPYLMWGVSPVLRFSWTLGNWINYKIKGDHDKRKIHSPRVMATCILPLPFPFSVIPAGAYLLSIYEENPRIGLAMNDNLLKEFKGKGLEEAMNGIGSNGFVKPFVKSYDWISHIKPVSWLQEKILGYNTKQAHDVLVGYLMEGARKNV